MKHCRGWRDLARYRRIPGYRNLSWIQRKRLDHLALWHALRAGWFWRILLWLFAGLELSWLLIWMLDLAGAARDLVRSLPFVAAIPALAAGRRREILKLVRRTRPGRPARSHGRARYCDHRHRQRVADLPECDRWQRAARRRYPGPD